MKHNLNNQFPTGADWYWLDNTPFDEFSYDNWAPGKVLITLTFDIIDVLKI